MAVRKNESMRFVDAALDGLGGPRSAVRALLDVVGLFPAGSFVRLSTGHIALVGACGGGHAERAADRPVVHIVQPSGSAKRYGQAIDLARVEPKALRVVEAVRAPEGV